MSKQKKTPIKYTTRDFDSIKSDIVEHAKRFYPEQWKDFSQGTINSLLVDSVAYVGDVLSYYLDYQTNESFLDSAIEFNNIRKHARALGYKFAGSANSYGFVSLFCLIPSNTDGTAPDFNYMPIIKRGATFTAGSGGVFTLTEDVSFDSPDSDVVAARFDDTTGATTYFAVKTVGQVVSGTYSRITVNLQNSAFEKFKRIRIGDSSFSEVISVVDADGNHYYEVDNLAQEVVFRETTNKQASSEGVRSILKPFVADRRFVVEQDDTGTYIQFGFGSEHSEAEEIADPSKVFLEMHGKNYISTQTFDPAKLIGTTKLGVAPSSTTLTVVAKANTTDLSSASAGSITSIGRAKMSFPSSITLDPLKKSTVTSSLEVNNEEAIVGATERMTNEELRQRAKSYYSSQGRAVTRQDYESLIYNMPNKFGIIKRVSVVNDPSATNRRMAIYVISEDKQGRLVECNDRLKQNVKHWLSQYKSLNDVVDIFDAKIINFGIDFKVAVDPRFSNENVLSRCNAAIRNHFSNQLYIGEPIYITRLYSILSKVEGVADVKRVNVYQKTGAGYSMVRMNFKEALSQDGTFIRTPKNVIMELKNPARDIKGVLVK
jgi:phage-related baseplate assembly protein